LRKLAEKAFLMIRSIARPASLWLFAVCFSLSAHTHTQAQMVLSRPVRNYEFLPVVGQRAALLGNESGRFEAWVWPLKLLRNFHLNFLAGGRILPADSLARTLSVRPESATILYAGDTFQVEETLFVPVHEPGAILIFEVDTAEPVEIEAVFERDFQLEWPAAIGGTYLNWNPALNAFYFGEEQKKYAGLVGSPSAVSHTEEYQTNYSETRQSSLRLGATAKGKEIKLLVMAASLEGADAAAAEYRKLAASYAELRKDSAAYYRDYLARTVNLELPDTQLQQSYDWARVSMVQGLVDNPLMGTGLVAGYRTSGDYERPGFAWFFGRDSLWTDFALDAAGDYSNTRTALDFLSKYQRADGKIEHELAQSATLVDWFKAYPYAYVSADATPLYIATMNDYVEHSGDVVFAREKWDSLWRAYQFLRSTYDSQTGFPRNLGVGHGWVEGGPLLPVSSELYQAGLGAEALRSLANLAHLVGKDDVSQQLSQQFEQQKTAINQAFWSAEKKFYGFALDTKGQREDIASVLTTVPMWFGVLDSDKTNSTIDQLADFDNQADWGMRIISANDPHYNPGGYHYGAVWPLFTGWASVAEYGYHRSLPAYENLRANALLAFDGSLGHTTEVLSGDFYQQLSTSSPHQIWSAAMVVSPMLRGMLGLSVNALTHTLTLAPEVPADWTSFTVKNVHVGDCVLDLAYRKDADGVGLQVQRNGGGNCTLAFSPAFSLRAEVLGAELNGRRLPAKAETNLYDQHTRVSFQVAAGSASLRIRTRNDFGVSYHASPPQLGSRSEGLRIINEGWDAGRTQLALDMSGIAGKQYDMAVWNAGQVSSVEGGELLKDKGTLRVQVPAGPPDTYVHHRVTIHFAAQWAK
jgi:glycogen debranching enzyme